MMRSDVLTLIAENPAAHGIFNKPAETRRTVFCRIRSVSSQEFYSALEQSLHPSFVFILADYAEYSGEKICEYNGVRYRITRTYVTAQQTVELTAEEATVDG